MNLTVLPPGGEDGCVRIWDLRMRNLQCQRIYQAQSPVNSVVLHPNQQEILVGDQARHPQQSITLIKRTLIQPMGLGA